MQIKPAEDIAQYHQFIAGHELGHFMQTAYWAELKSAFGWQNLGQYIIEDGSVKAAFSILKKSKLGINILYIPRGPVCNYQDKELADFVLDQLRQIARREKAFFLRISPAILETDSSKKELFLKNTFYFSKKQLQTKATTVIDLTRTEEELLASFHEKTRYNIRLAAKKGVTVTTLGTEAELKDFYKIMRQMSGRQDYTLQPYEYYFYIWQKLGDIARIYLAKNDQNKVIGGLVIFTFAGKAYYMYGGFDYVYRNLMGNYLVHWQVMRDAKAAGVKSYDLQGIPLIKDENHPMYGFYRFKKGFNGQELEFIGEYDHYINPLLYKLWNNINFEKNLYLQ
jgi:peptidoglycan pentaglycine glycine transferase (the first glycine)